MENEALRKDQSGSSLAASVNVECFVYERAYTCIHVRARARAHKHTRTHARTHAGTPTHTYIHIAASVKTVVKKRKKRKKEANQEANGVGEQTTQLPVLQLSCSSDVEADAKEDDVHVLSAAIDTFGKTGKRIDDHKGELKKHFTKLAAKEGPAGTKQASAEGSDRVRLEKGAAAAREGDVEESRSGHVQVQDAPAPSPVRSRLPLHQVTRSSKTKLHGSEGDTRNNFRRSSPCAGPLMASSGGAEETHDSGDDTLARFDKSHLGPQGRRTRGRVGAQSTGKTGAAEWVAVVAGAVISESEPREAQSRTASARELQMSGHGGGGGRSSSVPNSVLHVQNTFLRADQSQHELARPVRPNSSLVRRKSSEARAREETQGVTTTQGDGGGKLVTGRSMPRGSSARAMRDWPSAAGQGTDELLGSPLGFSTRRLLVCSAGNLTVSNGFPILAGWQTRKLGSCSWDEKSRDLRRGLRGPRKDASERKLLASVNCGNDAPPHPYNNTVTVHPCAVSGLVLMGSRLI